MEFNILARSSKNREKYSMCQIWDVWKCYLFLIFTCFLWTHPLRSKPINNTSYVHSLKNLLCFSSICENLNRAYFWGNISEQWLGKYYCILGRIWVRRDISKQVWFVLKAAGFMVMAAMKHQENCTFIYVFKQHCQHYLIILSLWISTPLPLHIPYLKDNSHNLTKYKSQGTSKIPISQPFRELGNIWTYSLS